MKILLFTPVATVSAIARVSRLVTNEFRRLGYGVTIVNSQYGGAVDLSKRDFGVEIIEWTDEARVLGESIDSLAIYQIGNNHDFHGGAIPWLSRIPGIVCLHDFYVAHLFNGWAHHNRVAAENVLRRWYGEKMASRYFELAAKKTFIEDTVEAAPMTEWIASQALAVVTHSQWGLRRVSSSCAGPTRVVPLAYEAELSSQSASGHHSGNSDAHVNLLTVGHINSNKRVASVIQAIGSSTSLRRHVTYRLVGCIAPDAVIELSELAAAEKVRLLISGAVSDELLSIAFAEADIVSCLRWPTLEAASASAIEAMLHGKPTIVTDAGFYSDIPDDCVEKTGLANEVNEIRSALERLQSSENERHALGERARRWASSTFTTENYCEQLVAMSAAIAKYRPIAEAKAFYKDVVTGWCGKAGEAYLDSLELSLPTTTR